MIHPLKSFNKWRADCYWQFVLVPGALSGGQMMTVSPQVLLLRAINWVTNPDDRDMPKDEGYLKKQGDLERLRHSYANCDEYIEGCEIEPRPRLDEKGFVDLLNRLADEGFGEAHEIFRHVENNYVLDW